MGLTPLEGLIMGTRSGDIDPAVVQFIANHENKSIDEILNLLNKKSGVLGLSGVSSDFRDLDKAEAEGNERAKLANDAFKYRVIKYIGAYAAAMNGVDAIAFTAGVGENSAATRKAIVVRNGANRGACADDGAQRKHLLPQPIRHIATRFHAAHWRRIRSGTPSLRPFAWLRLCFWTNRRLLHQ